MPCKNPLKKRSATAFEPPTTQATSGRLDGLCAKAFGSQSAAVAAPPNSVMNSRRFTAFLARLDIRSAMAASLGYLRLYRRNKEGVDASDTRTCLSSSIFSVRDRANDKPDQLEPFHRNTMPGKAWGNNG